MTRLLPAALCLLLSGSAQAAASGLELGLGYGVGAWSMDRQRLAGQVGPAADVFLGNLPTAQMLSLRLGFNVLGHATVEADLTATGWKLSSIDRGGGGIVSGQVAWHPLQIWIPERNYDGSLVLGYGYGLVGKTVAEDGGVLTWGARGEYRLSPTLGVGGSLLFHHTLFDRFILDYDQRAVPGNTVPLADGSGGLFFTVGAQIVIHADLIGD